MKEPRAPLPLAVLLIVLAGLLSGCARRSTSVKPTQTASASPTPSATPLDAGVASPSAIPVHYTVQAGDSLARIADRYETTVGALSQANGLSGALLHTGQDLLIPTSTSLAQVDPKLQATPSANSTPAEFAPSVASGPATVISRGPRTSHAVALTFDAGADVGYSALILDILNRNGIQATFGMTGQWAQTNPGLVQRMAADGHELMNHSWDHRSFTGLSTRARPLSQAQRLDELNRTEAIILQLTGESTRPFFRAPYGDQDASVQNDVGAQGYRYDVLWTVDTHGWAGASVAEILSRSTQGAVPGAIYVMHVDSASKDGLALQGVIDAIRAKGLGFETVSQLLGDG